MRFETRKGIEEDVWVITLTEMQRLRNEEDRHL